MSGLHTMGYRPGPGERVGGPIFRGRTSPARDLWLSWWAFRRARGCDAAAPPGCAARRFDGLARASLAAREAAEVERSTEDGMSLDERINARGWDVWDSPLERELRPKWGRNRKTWSGGGA
jgi:hypothetical protein